MRDRRLLTLLLGLGLALLSSRATLAEEAAAPADEKEKNAFLRVLRNDDGEPTALQTSITRYTDGKGLTVDLIGAVHVGDKSYYEELNKIFEEYDALLYELVAPEGTRVPKGGARGGFNPVSGMQRGMQSMLDLEFQLDCIDYTRPNFVHADMSPEEFSKSMKEKNESMLGLMFRMMGQNAKVSASNSAKGGDADLLMALFSKDRSFRLKRAMANQFENMDAQMAVIEGKDGSTIIAARNAKALEVLQRQIDGGKKKMGIFYGAGHLADMHKRLEKDFGLKKESERWLTAWSMEDSK